MKGKVRHYFPGNNTPGGFFSYYRELIDQRDAERVWYLKGGPGTGKSTFIGKIGEGLLSKGFDTDFLHCSSDSASLDGIMLRNRSILLVDGTAPHVLDPINPGAVDSIINLGDCWDEEGLRKKKEEIIDIKEGISEIFRQVYNYLGAAEKMYDILAGIPCHCLSDALTWDIAEMIAKETIRAGVCKKEAGRLRRFFAAAITPEGIRHYLPSLIATCKKTYVIKTYAASGSENIILNLQRRILNEGIDVEAFYCSMKPSAKPEHLVAPQLSLAVVSSNPYHNLETDELNPDVICIDFAQNRQKPFEHESAEESLKKMNELLERAVILLGDAKSKHEALEEIYGSYMDFEKLDRLRLSTEKQIYDSLLF